MKAIIPTGGRGTRMQPYTFLANKHFIPVANKPLLFYPIESVAKAGIKEVAITFNPGFEESVRELLGDGSRWGLKFTYILQPKPLGVANIFEVCEDYLNGEDFFLHLGDNIFTGGIKSLVDHFAKKRPDGLVAMVEHPENRRLGVPYFDKKGRLKKYVEKPKNPPHQYAIPGIYFFNKNVFKCFKGRDRIKLSARGEYEIASPYQWLIDHDYEVEVIKYEDKWLDPGKTDDWLAANRYLLDIEVREYQGRTPEKNSKIEGRVDLGKNVKISHSTIRGPVRIGDKVEIKDSFVGPYTSIDQDCKIRGARINNSILMREVVIDNFPKPIDSSMLGPGTEMLANSDTRGDYIEMLVGAKSKVVL